jgi:hypothetical protein
MTGQCITFARKNPYVCEEKPITFARIKNTEYPMKTTDLPQVTDKLLSHNIASSTPRLSGIQAHII